MDSIDSFILHAMEDVTLRNARKDESAEEYVPALKRFILDEGRAEGFERRTLEQLKTYVRQLPSGLTKFQDTLWNYAILISAGLAGAFAASEQHTEMASMFGAGWLAWFGKLYAERDRKAPSAMYHYLEQHEDELVSRLTQLKLPLAQQMTRYGHFT